MELQQVPVQDEEVLAGRDEPLPPVLHEGAPSHSVEGRWGRQVLAERYGELHPGLHGDAPSHFGLGLAGAPGEQVGTGTGTRP